MFFTDEAPFDFNKELNRRRFLKFGIIFAGVTFFPNPVLAAVNSITTQDKSLSFYNVHTGEKLQTTYWLNGEYIAESVSRINHILRDHHIDEVKPIDNRLLDLLYFISKKLKTKQAFHIISGYRSPSTNEILRKSNSDVAKNSLHIYGKAADIYLPGYRLSSVRRAAMDAKSGGVGYYPKHHFIHIDVGQIRYW